MNKIEIKGTEYDFIGGFDEMNLETDFKFIKILQDEKSNLYKLMDIISLFSGISVDMLKKCNLDAIKSIDINWCFKEIDKEIVKVFEINGVKYGFVDVNNLTLAEYADLEYVSQEKEAEYQNIHKVTAILYRPLINDIVEEYNSDTLNERAELFKDEMPISVLYPVFNFFLNIGSVL